MIEFFAQTNNKDQESIALKELQYIKEIENKMNFYLNLNFKNFETNPLIILAKSDIK